MDTSQLKQLLRETENPKIEFKSGWYCSTDQLDDKGWGEFLKDIISLANGNIGYIGQTGYLIVGASDTDPEYNKLRDTFHVSDVGMLSNIQKLREVTLRKVREICSPPLSDIKIYFIELEEYKNLLIIEIPSPIDILKLDRDLNTRGMRFKKGTVLIRIGQDISVADPTEISVIKQEYSKKNFNNLKHKRLLHNLPQPDYINFVGRKNELERLRKLLHPQDRIWTVVIDGIGGIGKSSLALEVAYSYLNEHDFLPNEERFEAIIWLSAKTSVLTADGIKNRYQFTNTISDIYKEISIALENDNIYRNNFTEQDILIKRCLSQQRTLLIIDNYETIDDERINSFIRELPNPTKCIVTTRHRIDIADPIRLSAMPREDAISLIKQECQKKDVQLTEEQIELLYKRTAGVPLAVVWSIAQVSHHGFGIDKVLRNLGDAKGDIARFCFETAIRDLQNKPAYKLLICAGLSLQSLSRQEFRYISDLSELDCDEGLVILEKLSLLNNNSGRFHVISLVREYISSYIPNFSFDELKRIITKISQNYAPSGADAVSLIEPFFSIEAITLLKEEVTKIVVNQMWEWDEQNDQLGVPYCIAALTQLATDEAIRNIKYIAYNTQMYHDGWVCVAAINALIKLKKIRDLIELSLIDNTVSDIVYNGLKKLEIAEVVTEIDKFKETTSGEKSRQFLQQLRNKILS